LAKILQELAIDGFDFTVRGQDRNETGYTIIRSSSAAGTYSSVGTVAAKATSFVDTTVNGGVQYWYRVYATNGHGSSPYTDSVTIVTTDRIPKVNPIANVTLTSGQSTTVNVSAVDDATIRAVMTMRTMRMILAVAVMMVMAVIVVVVMMVTVVMMVIVAVAVFASPVHDRPQ